MGIFINKRGSVTVFLSLIMAGVLLFTVIMVDASKIIGARSMVAGAGDMSLNAGLTYYNSVLQDTYGIFAISKDEKELEKNLQVYFEATLKANGLGDNGLASQLARQIVHGGNDVSELMDLQAESFTVKKVDGSALTETEVLRSQILEYCKYRAPVVIGYGFLEKLNIFKTLPKQQEALKKKAAYEKELSAIEKLCKEIFENAQKYEGHLTDNGGDYKPSSPDDIITFTIIPCNLEYPNMTSDAIAYQVLSELQCTEDWSKDINNSGGRKLTDSIKDLSTVDGGLSGSLRRLGELYAEVTATSAEKSWHKFESAVKYYQEYLRCVSLFQNVPQQYRDAKKEFEDELERLEEELAAEEADEDGDPASVRRKITALKEAWELKKKWYDHDFRPVGRKYSWDTVRNNFNNELKNEINSIGGTLELNVKYHYNWAKELLEYGNATRAGLLKLIDKAELLNELGIEWKGAINNLDASDVKSSMELEQQNKAEVIKKDHIEKTIEILDGGIQYANDIMAEMEDIEYINIGIAHTSLPSTGWLNVTTSAVKAQMGEELVISNNDELKAFQINLHDEKRFYDKIDESTQNQIYNVQGLAESNGAITEPKLWNYIRMTDWNGDASKNDVVYAFLERSVKAGEVNPKEKEAAQKQRSDMAKEVEESALKDLPDGSVEDVMNSGGGKKAETINVSDSDEAESVVDSAVSATGNALKSFDLESLGNILVSGRDKLYLMTYAANMFSCYTTEEGTETLTNVPYNATNNALFHAEQEYILWGKDSAEDNVKSTRDTIFGIRLLLNIIYAYTGDPQLKTETLTMATAIAGWTGFGVPIVQNALLIIAALAESVWDTNRLVNDRESVPLYKTTSTWAFRYNGVDLERAMRNAIEAGSTKLYEEMNKITSATSDTFNDELDKYINNTIETTVNTAINAVQAPVMEVILWAASHMEHAKDNLRKELEDKVEQCFVEMEKTFQREKDNANGNGAIMAEMKLQALSLYNTSSNKKALVDMMWEASKIDDGVNQTKALSDKVEEWFNQRRTLYEQALRDKLEKTGVVKSLKTNVDSILMTANSDAQEAINEELNEFMNKMGSSSTSMSGSGSDELFADFDSVSASTFSMNYQEYVMVFLAIRFLTAEKEAICCMGNLIQTNATKKVSAYFAGESFHLDKAYTMLQVEGEASIRPTFIKLPDMTADLGGTLKERYSIRYKGVLGY